MSDFNIQFEEQDQSITLEFEQIGGGAVKSVNGKVGEVVLGASDVGALPSSTSIPAVDNTLTVAGAAADAKKTGDELSSLKEDISHIGGLSEDIKQAMLQIARKVAYVDDQGQTYYDDLYDALYAVTAIHLDARSIMLTSIGSTQQLTATTTPAGGAVTWASSDTSIATVSNTGLVTSVGYGSCTITASSGSVSASCAVAVSQVTLTSITADYQQSGTVYDTDSLDSLKSDLVVTATYSDSSTQTVTDYTLSGTLAVGTSTVTVAYGGKATTFTVTVTELVIVIPNGSFTFDDGSSVTVHNNHVQIFLKTHVHAASTGGRFVNLSSLNSNTSSIFSNDNVNNKSTEYLSAEVGDVVTVGIKNATADNSTWDVAGSAPPYNVAMNLKKKNSTSSALSRAVTVYPADNSKYGIVRDDEVIDTVSSAYIAANLFCYIAYTFPAETTIDFDVYVSKE